MEDFTDKKAIKLGTDSYTFEFMCHWEPSWHSPPMIKLLKKKGFKPKRVNRTRRPHKRGYYEQKCIWKASPEVFDNLSGHSKQLAILKTGYDHLFCVLFYLLTNVFLSSPCDPEAARRVYLREHSD